MNRDPLVVIDEFLARTDVQLHKNAVLALGAIRNKRAAERLLRVALEDRDAEVREAAEDELVDLIALDDLQIVESYKSEKDFARRRQLYGLLGRLRARGAKIPPLPGSWGPAMWLFGIAYPKRGLGFYFRAVPAALGGAFAAFILMEIVFSLVASTSGLGGGVSKELSTLLIVGAGLGIVLAAFATCRTTAAALHAARRGRIIEIVLAMLITALTCAALGVPYIFATSNKDASGALLALSVLLTIAIGVARLFVILGGGAVRSRWANVLVATTCGAVGSMVITTLLIAWILEIDPSLFSSLWLVVLTACGAFAAAFASIDARVPSVVKRRSRIVAGIMISLAVALMADLFIALYLTRAEIGPLVKLASSKLPVGTRIQSASGGSLFEAGLVPYRVQLNLQEPLWVTVEWSDTDRSVVLAKQSKPLLTFTSGHNRYVTAGLYDLYYGLGSATSENQELQSRRAMEKTFAASMRPIRGSTAKVTQSPVTPRYVRVVFRSFQTNPDTTDTAMYDTAMTMAIDTAMTDTISTDTSATSSTMSTDTSATSSTMATDTSVTSSTMATDTSVTSTTGTTETAATDTLATAFTGTLSTAYDPNPTSGLARAQSQLNSGITHALQGDVARALLEFEASQRTYPYFDIPSQAWNTLCRSGALFGHAREVMSACDKAVQKSVEGDARPHESRGVVLALTGNYAGAIKDLEQSRGREAWIAELRKGRNPFTANVLKELWK